MKAEITQCKMNCKIELINERKQEEIVEKEKSKSYKNEKVKNSAKKHINEYHSKEYKKKQKLYCIQEKW